MLDTFLWNMYTVGIFALFCSSLAPVFGIIIDKACKAKCIKKVIFYLLYALWVGGLFFALASPHSHIWFANHFKASESISRVMLIYESPALRDIKEVQLEYAEMLLKKGDSLSREQAIGILKKEMDKGDNNAAYRLGRIYGASCDIDDSYMHYFIAECLGNKEVVGDTYYIRIKSVTTDKAKIEAKELCQSIRTKIQTK